MLVPSLLIVRFLEGVCCRVLSGRGHQFPGATIRTIPVAVAITWFRENWPGPCWHLLPYRGVSTCHSVVWMPPVAWETAYCSPYGKGYALRSVMHALEYTRLHVFVCVFHRVVFGCVVHTRPCLAFASDVQRRQVQPAQPLISSARTVQGCWQRVDRAECICQACCWGATLLAPGRAHWAEGFEGLAALYGGCASTCTCQDCPPCVCCYSRPYPACTDTVTTHKHVSTSTYGTL